jgi:hypothetical protein
MLLTSAFHYGTDIRKQLVNLDRFALPAAAASTIWAGHCRGFSGLPLKKPSMSGAAFAPLGKCSTPSARRLKRKILSW